MAVTGAIFKSLIFDDIDSRNYGVYITGEAVYNAPEREVEMITIAGRNGQLALDKGRFENIEVTYPAGIFADTQADYAKAISDFRNALCSKVGYQRLTDEYNVDEYRMAVYKSGLEVSSVNSAGEFQITFDCQPQRFLMSGEAPITVASGDTILNPAHFDSKPMLEVEGYGTIEFNGFEIELENAVLGETRISESSYNATVKLNVENLNIGDAIKSKSINEPYARLKITAVGAITNYSASVQTGDGSVSVSQQANNILSVTISPKLTGLAYGTSATITTETSVTIQIGNASNSGTFETTVTYDGNQKITINSALVSSSYPSGTKYTPAYRHPEYYGDSSKPLLGDPTYIDCDLGEAYKYVGDKLVSLNQYIDLGSELPTLASGNNEITYDNTITDLKVTPRWWVV